MPGSSPRFLLQQAPPNSSPPQAIRASQVVPGPGALGRAVRLPTRNAGARLSRRRQGHPARAHEDVASARETADRVFRMPAVRPPRYMTYRLSRGQYERARARSTCGQEGDDAGKSRYPAQSPCWFEVPRGLACPPDGQRKNPPAGRTRPFRFHPAPARMTCGERNRAHA